MSSKYPIDKICKGCRAENIRVSESVEVISLIDEYENIWIVQGENENLYLEHEYNLVNPFVWGD